MSDILHIYEPMYRINFYYILATTQPDFCKILNDELNIEMEPKHDLSFVGRFVTAKKAGTEVGIIWTSNRNPEFIAHECLHAAFWTMESRGIVLSYSSEEAFTYMLQFLVAEVHTYLQKRFAK